MCVHENLLDKRGEMAGGRQSVGMEVELRKVEGWRFPEGRQDFWRVLRLGGGRRELLLEASEVMAMLIAAINPTTSEE